MTRYGSVKIEGVDIFYREAGSPEKPALLLLHGFPSSSHMFRDLIPALEDRFHLIAPDYPGFGRSGIPPRSSFSYTFDHLADIVRQFADVMGLGKFFLYVFDYGAPIGFRLAKSEPARILASSARTAISIRKDLAKSGRQELNTGAIQLPNSRTI